jgi:hypothetical protein
MNIAAGPFVIAALLLAIGGALKAARPGDTANAIRAVGLPGGPWLVRVGGAVEVAVGVYALVVGDRVSAVLVAVSYLAFSLFVVAALRAGAPIATCGCFGKADTPPSGVHVAVNMLLVVAAVAVATDPGVAISDVLAGQPLGGAPFGLLVVIGVGAVFVALTALPRTLALVRRIPAS